MKKKYPKKSEVKKGYKVLRLWENEIVNMNLNQFNNKMLQYGRTQQ